MPRTPAYIASPSQKLLLKVALGRDDVVRQAWSEWKSKNDIEQLDFSSFRLLPMVSKKIEAFVPREPLLSKLKGVYRYNWARNQKTLHRTKLLLASIQETKSPVLVLKGLALALSNYRDIGLRYMNDVDLLVPEISAESLLAHLRSKGYTGVQASHHTYNPVWHAATLQDGTGARFDIHWHALFLTSHHGLTEQFWKHSHSMDLGDFRVNVLDPTDQLIHVCIHGFSWAEEPSIRWIADAHVILSDPLQSIDWSRLVSTARTFRLTSMLFKMFDYLKSDFDLPIPTQTINQLRQSSRPGWEEREQRVRSFPTGVVSAARLVYYAYRRTKESDRHANMTFTQFLTHYRYLDRPSQLPKALVSWAAKKSWSRLMKNGLQ